MQPTGGDLRNQRITTPEKIPFEAKYRCGISARGALVALLLLFAACSQNTEPLSPASKDAVSSPSSGAPASSAQERAVRHDGAGAARRESFSSRHHYYPRPPIISPSTDRFPDKEPSGILSVAEHPVSTFSVDVDTASYAFVRRNLVGGRLPPREAVRVEEMINYFPYAYPIPQDRGQPFRVATTVLPSPWSADNRLLHIAIRGYDTARAERPRANIVLQIEFNPAHVAEYRLIGYETRMLRRGDFKDDKIDAGDIGAGHTVTAIYEFTPAGAKQRRIDPLRYRSERERAASPISGGDELAFVKLRYKLPGESTSRLIDRPVRAADTLTQLSDAHAEQRFAVAVAAFAQRLRGESAVDGFTYANIAELANSARGVDAEGYRAEFVRLVRMAETLGAVAQR